MKQQRIDDKKDKSEEKVTLSKLGWLHRIKVVIFLSDQGSLVLQGKAFAMLLCNLILNYHKPLIKLFIFVCSTDIYSPISPAPQSGKWSVFHSWVYEYCTQTEEGETR